MPKFHKYHVTTVQVVYQTVEVEVSDERQGDPEEAARWQAVRGIGKPVNEAYGSYYSDVFPYQDWEIEHVGETEREYQQ